MSRSTISTPPPVEGSIPGPGLAPVAAVALDPQVAARAAEAKALGVAWATELQRTLRAENRRAAGGWPGTLREANSRARFLISKWQVAGSVILNQQQSGELAKTVYASAKATWLSQSEPEEPDVDVES